MAKGKLVRVGIIGLGAIGPAHIRGYQACGNAEIVAVCDIRKDLAEHWAKKLKADAYTSYLELLKTRLLRGEHPWSW